jgi:hypothetical protein
MARENDPRPLQFVTVCVLEARRDSLIMEVIEQHASYDEAKEYAKKHAILAFPYKLGEALESGERINWPKGMSPIIDRAWRDERRRVLGIKLVR